MVGCGHGTDVIIIILLLTIDVSNSRCVLATHQLVYGIQCISYLLYILYSCIDDDNTIACWLVHVSSSTAASRSQGEALCHLYQVQPPLWQRSGDDPRLLVRFQKPKKKKPACGVFCLRKLRAQPRPRQPRTQPRPSSITLIVDTFSVVVRTIYVS